MDNNIVIKITSEAQLSEVQKELTDLIKRSEDLEIEMSQMQTAYENEVAAIKKSNKTREEQVAELLKLKQRYRDIKSERKEEAKELNQSIKAINDSIKAYKTLNGQSGKIVQQLRAMREELQRMEDAGEFGTKAFMDLAIKASELEDKIGDTQQAIRILASDTKNLDAVMGLGDGLSGTFYMATSGAELLGGEMEGLQQAFYKVQAMMSVVNGLTQVSNILNAKSNFNLVVTTKLLKNKRIAEAAAAVATGKATIAQRILNTVMLSNPAAFVITAIVALVAAYTTLSQVLGNAGDKQARLNKMQAENKVEALRDATELEINLMQAQGKTALEVAKKKKAAKEEEVAILKDAYEKSFKAWEDSNMFNRSKREEEMKEAKEAYEQAAKDLVSANDDILVQKRQQQIDYEKSTMQATIDIMNEGAAKEIAAINLNYEDRLKNLKGNTADEIALRKALEKQKAKEIADVRRKYALQAQQTAIQEQKNLLTAMSQSGGTEADYAKQVQLTKDIAEAEAKARIDALDKRLLGDKEYEAQKEAIELELAARIKQIEDDEVARQEENSRRISDIVVKEAEARKKALTGKESVEEQKAIIDELYEARRDQLEENARMEIAAVERSTETEEVKAAKILEIETNLAASREELRKEQAEADLDVDKQYLTDLEIAADQAADKLNRASGVGKLEALKENLDAQKALYAEQQSQLDDQLAAGLITFDEYKKQEWEITKATADAEAEYVKQKTQTIAEGFSTALGQIQSVSDMVFDALSSSVQAELDALDEEYTTDAEEARKNANKKYITQEEYDKKKAALELKQAKYAKAQALINAGINTSLAITNALTTWPISLGIAMAAIAGAMGAAQMAIIAAKPLAQYEKGRKGGPGEYALVGEKGPEIMYVPRGASIVPNGLIKQQEEWGRFGVPRMDIPELPSINTETSQYITTTADGRLTIDYDRLGEAVARNIPAQKTVSINVDRSGIMVTDGHDTHKYLNRKYAGAWM